MPDNAGAGKPAIAGQGEPAPVRAAGAVLWQPGDDGQPLVAVVHRPRYDDWSLPKGKLDRGETPAQAAVREVEEETGFSSVLSRWLAQVTYPVTGRGGVRATKLVDYFVARADSGTFRPNHEVDELRWLTTGEAREQLSYPHDEHVLAEFSALPVSAATILLVRHAEAGNREEFTGPDTLRPLSRTGREQQRALNALLLLFQPERAYSAPRLRCEQTIEGIAGEFGLDIRTESALSEEGYWSAPHATRALLLRIASLGGTSVVCSQGGVIPGLITTLADESSLDLRVVRSKKSSVWTLSFTRAAATGTMRLAAAHYLPDPLQQ